MMKKDLLLILGTLIFILFLISFSSAYEIYYYHTDNLGSPVAITDENASVVWSADYEPFGKTFNEVSSDDNNPRPPLNLFPQPQSTDGNSHQYNAKEKDNSGLLYYGARYYDADLGRFTTADTIAGKIEQPPTLNKYVYVLNNPLKYVDPTGNEIMGNAEIRYSGYTSPQFTPFPHSLTSWGFRVGLEKDFKYGSVKSTFNTDTIVSGNNIFTKATHPIYNAYGLDSSLKIGKLGLSFEHTSSHAQSLGTSLSTQLKDYPSIIPSREYNSYGENINPGISLREDFHKTNTKTKLDYFGETNILSLSYYPSSSLETYSGIAKAQGYSTLNSVLGLKGPPVLIGSSHYGLFARTMLTTDVGTLSLAGIGGSNPLFTAGFQSNSYNLLADVFGAKFFGIYGSGGNYGCGITLNCGFEGKLSKIVSGE